MISKQDALYWLMRLPFIGTYELSVIRRMGLVELTDQGRELASRLTPAMAQFMARMTHGFTEEEKQTFIRLVDRFHRNALNSYLQEDPSA
jgi:DNA-binding MarR family transcriptional regulator